MPASVHPSSLPTAIVKQTVPSDAMKNLSDTKSTSTASSHSLTSGSTGWSSSRSNAGKPVCIDSIDDSYRNYGDWSHMDIDTSARSHPGFGLVRESNSFNEHYESLDISTRTAPGFGIRRDSDIESSGSKQKYLTYVDSPVRKLRKSLPDLSSGLPTLRESIESKQVESLLRDVQEQQPASPTFSRSDRKSLSRSLTRGASWRRSSRRFSNKDSEPNGAPNRTAKPVCDEDIDQGSLLPATKWWHGFFIFSIVSLLACTATLWAPYPYGARMPTEMVAETPWSDGCQNGLSSCICPRETVCADSMSSMIFLTISRCSAWFDYPLYMVLFLSKCNNLNNYLQKTVLRCFINFSDYHKVHRLFGIIVGIESASHSFFHLFRWKCRSDDIKLLYTSQTGITGLISLVCGTFVILPMTLPYLKRCMTYEWRKGLHYLSIAWAVALMYHAPQRIFWMIGVPLVLYTLDKTMEIFSRTHLIESAHFERLSDTCCIISFENPPGFGKQNSAYVYLMLPWLSRYQFHAFTVFPSNKPNHSSICISKCGNWTQSLIKEITTPTHKPAFIMGPFLSPFSSPAMDSENLVAVASGIGVTPAISLIKQYSCTSRRMNLIWICRDAALVEHFLQNLAFCASESQHLLVYYTGKRPLFLSEANDLPPNVCIFNGRPNLERTISGVIHSIANDDGLPDELYQKNSVVTKASPEISAKLILVKALSIYSIDQLFEYAVRSTSITKEEIPPWAAASFDGVLKMIDDLLSDDCEVLKRKALKNLDLVDNYGSSMLNKDMFEDFMQLMMGVQLPDVPQSTISSSQDSKLTLDCMDISRVSVAAVNDTISNGKFGIKKILRGDGKYSAKKWNMLYCGGSEPVLAQLRAYKHKYSIGLSVEKFDW